MIFHVLTLFPEAFDGFITSSILGKAVERELIKINLINIRDFTYDKHRTCDDAPYGGGAGMILKPEPLACAIESIKVEGIPVIFLSPGGKLFNQEYASAFSREKELVLISGHYEGIDQRIIDRYVTEEISIGDYILSSGVAASMVIIDVIARLVPGVIKAESHAVESFHKGLLEYPQYTRPEEFREMKVPDVLLSGHHANIEKWRLAESFKKTLKSRPELIEYDKLTTEEKKLLAEIRGKGV